MLIAQEEESFVVSVVDTCDDATATGIVEDEQRATGVVAPTPTDTTPEATLAMDFDFLLRALQGLTLEDSTVEESAMDLSEAMAFEMTTQKEEAEAMDLGESMDFV